MISGVIAMDVPEKTVAKSKIRDNNKNKLFGEAWVKKENFVDDAQNAVDLAFSLKAHRFTESVTMHGVRYMFLRDTHFLRRLIWTCVVLGGLGYCSYIIFQSFKSYYTYPTTLRINTVFEAKGEFPAVTICPYNTFQRSAMTPRQIQAVKQVFGEFYFPLDGERVNLSDFDDLNFLEFLRNTSFQYPTNYCTYEGKLCGKELLHTYLTDYGFCRVFDPSADPDLKAQTSIGQTGGMDFGEVVNESEWTFGPFLIYDGFRVTVHAPGTRVHYLRDKGFSLLPGFTTEVVLKRQKITILPPPHGQCGQTNLSFYDSYSREDCLLECETNHTVEVCGCKFFYMPGDAQICRLSQMPECLHVLKDAFGNESKIFDQTKCQCPQQCNYTDFELEVIHTAPTKGWTEILKKYLNVDLSQGLQMRVYYQDFEYTKIEQVAIYSVEKLICDIGGAAGLFLGCSFVTCFEFVDFVGELLWLSGFRRQRKTKKEKKTQPQTVQLTWKERIKTIFNQTLQTNSK